MLRISCGLSKMDHKGLVTISQPTSSRGSMGAASHIVKIPSPEVLFLMFFLMKSISKVLTVIFSLLGKRCL